MSSIQEWVDKYSVAAFCATTFFLSWGSLYWYVGGIEGFPALPATTDDALLIVVLATLLGPSMAGILVIYMVYGKQGLHKLWTRLHCWRAIGLNWYAVVLFTAPLLVTLVLVVLSLLVSSSNNDEYTPAILLSDDKTSLILQGIMYGALAGLFEETGWSGFLVPELMNRHGWSEIATGLVVGLIWGIWHFQVAYWGSGTSSGQLDWDEFIPWIHWNLAVLPTYRILMVWVYSRTQQSLLAMALLHGSLTASLPLILMPPVITGKARALFYDSFAVVLVLLCVIIYTTTSCNTKRRKTLEKDR